MAKANKITQNVNKDAGLLDLPKVKIPHSLWDSKHSNYVTSNIGQIVPIYCEEIMPDEKRRITMGMLSHMTTPQAPIFNAQYTEFRCFWVPHRLSADLLAGYSTRKSPWVKVFGEDNASASSSIVVPLANQTLPDVKDAVITALGSATLAPFGGILDAMDMETNITDGYARRAFYKHCNFLNLAAYELIYQKAYRNQNRESATESNLYKFLFNAYNKNVADNYDDSFHVASREKDYFTGSQPFTQKGDPVSVGLAGNIPVIGINADDGTTVSTTLPSQNTAVQTNSKGEISVNNSVLDENINFMVNLNSASGISIESLRLLIKTQEMLEKDAMYGSDYASSLNAHFGTSPISTELEEPLELKKVNITSDMQAIFQTSTTENEQSILGTIGANATTQSGDFEILPMRQFKEWGYLIICATHKAQNSYDSLIYKRKHLFKKSRFDFYTPELDDLGYQPVRGDEFNPKVNNLSTAVSFNEAWAEYRFYFNRVHGMFEPNRSNALDYWTLSIASYNDVQSLYKQSVTELDRAISVTSVNAPQFFDAYGFIEENSKPMKLHSIPGMDGVI